MKHLSLIFLGLILLVPLLNYVNAVPAQPWIPPTNAFDKIHTPNGTVYAVNFSMPLIIKGDGNINVNSSNSTHTVIVGIKSICNVNPFYNKVIQNVTVGSSPFGTGYSPATNDIYVSNSGDNNVTAINSANVVIGTIPVGGAPAGIGFSSTNNDIYVSNSGDNNVTAINSANVVIGTIPVGIDPQGISYSDVTHDIYVANSGDNTVSVINSANNVISTIPVGIQPQGVGFSPVTNDIYVSNTGDNTVSVIDSSNNVIKTISVGTNPLGISYSDITHEIYVANNGDITVSVIDSTNNVVNTITDGGSPNFIAFSTASGNLYVSESVPNAVITIDHTNFMKQTIPVGTSPQEVSYSDVTHDIYVVDFSDNKVSVIDSDPCKSFVGTYHKVTANNSLINNNGEIINLINGTGNPIHVINSNAGNKVNVTISLTTSGNAGTYNETLANNTLINSGGFKLNYINGTGNPVHVQNSNAGQQVNVTISSGSSGSFTTRTINLNSSSYRTILDNNTGTVHITATSKPTNPQFVQTISSGNIPTDTTDVQDYTVVLTVGGKNTNATTSKAISVIPTRNGIEVDTTRSVTVTNNNFWYASYYLSGSALSAGDKIGLKMWCSSVPCTSGGGLDFRYATIYIIPREFKSTNNSIYEIIPTGPQLTLSGAVSGVTYALVSVYANPNPTLIDSVLGTVVTSSNPILSLKGQNLSELGNTNSPLNRATTDIGNAPTQQAASNLLKFSFSQYIRIVSLS